MGLTAAVRFPAREDILLLNVQTDSAAHTVSCLMGAEGCFGGG
jgi:hypothetical protein